MRHYLNNKLKELEEMLRTNASVDWSMNETSPEEEFAALADIVKAALPTERDFIVDNLAQLICDDDIEAAYDRLVAQSEIDGSADAWDFVSIWEPFENDGWTVDQLLDRIL